MYKYKRVEYASVYELQWLQDEVAIAMLRMLKHELDQVPCDSSTSVYHLLVELPKVLPRTIYMQTTPHHRTWHRSRP